MAQALKAELLRCEVLHADETPVAVLGPGKGKTQRAYLWTCAVARSGPIKAVVHDFAPGRSGECARAFLDHDPERRQRDQRPWTGHLVCDDFSGYKALFELGVTEVGCMAHARRTFVELHIANKRSIAGAALPLIGERYQVERDINGLSDPDEWPAAAAKPISNALRTDPRALFAPGACPALSTTPRRAVVISALRSSVSASCRPHDPLDP